jgi:hypothetical protein
VSNKKKPKKTRVVLKRPRKVADLAVYGQNVHDQMAANSKTLPSPDPALTVLQTHLDELVTKEAAAKTRAVGAVSERDAAEKVVVDDLETERAYVEKTANADPDHADAIAQGAGMALRKTGSHDRPTLAVKHGAVSGAVEVAAKVPPGAKANDWQYSTDGGKTWIDVPSTTKAKTTVPSLQPGLTVHFRHRVLTKAGRSDWSDPVSLVVS